MDLTQHIERFQRRHAELEAALAHPAVYDDPDQAQELVREHRRLTKALEQAAELCRLERQLEENQALLVTSNDPELVHMARDEQVALEQAAQRARRVVLEALVPPDPHESRNTIVEIRAGTGGDEAALFAGDLFRMYSRYAERAGWTVEPLDSNPGPVGGFKEVVFQVTGDEVYRKLRFESGVHRVQRVPSTESQGRIHTSTATVAVLPEAREVDVVIRPDDLRIEVCRAGGPGGQGVNTTDSAVQITHLPSGMIVRCQDGRSQLKNREKALSVLRARLLEIKEREEREKMAAERRGQVGTGERNEKIRTYNFPQNRVTDHRIRYTSNNLDAVIDGDLEDLFQALLADDLSRRLEALGAGRL